MTNEEAIVQLKDLRKDRESFAENDEPDGVFEQDIEAIDIAVKALKENDKLKQLLKLAIEDFCKVRNVCDKGSDCRECPCNLDVVCEWKHADEVKEILEDEK